MVASTAEGYDPARSRVSDDKMAAWAQADMNGDLLQIPGIGPAAVGKLKDVHIVNSFQFLGHYMKMAELEEDAETDETHIDTYSLNHRFWLFLKNTGITAHRSAIVKAMSDKAGTILPGFLDANTYGDLADE